METEHEISPTVRQITHHGDVRKGIQRIEGTITVDGMPIASDQQAGQVCER